MNVTWTKSRKGFANIYKAEGLQHAIVDRRGFGLASAFGHSITYREKPFKSVAEAKEYAEKELKCE